MYKEIADSQKEKMKADQEVKDFIKNIEPNKYYAIPGTNKSIKGKSLKKLYNGKG